MHTQNLYGSLKNNMNITITIDTEPDYKTGKYVSTLDGLEACEILFDKCNIKPTLFVTCDCIEKFPQIFQRLKRKGWEISLHGYRHLRFDEMSKEEKENQLDKALSCFKKYLGIKPKGLRAPQFSSEFELLEVLEKKGFKYDSSIVQFPLSQTLFFRSKAKLYLNQMFFKSKLKKKSIKLKEIPVSSFILPISMFTLTKIPFLIFKLLTYLSYISRKDRTIIFLSHSYELTSKNLAKLEKFILNYKNASFVRMQDLI